MAPPLMSEPPETTAPPPTGSFMQKTISICSQINVRLPSALVSVASRCDSTRRTSPTNFTTCQRGTRAGEPSGWPGKNQGRKNRTAGNQPAQKNCWLGASEQGITPPEASSERAVKGEQNTSSDEIIFHYLSVSHWLIFKHSDRREASVPTKKLQLLTRPSGKSQFIINMFINWFFF